MERFFNVLISFAIMFTMISCEQEEEDTGIDPFYDEVLQLVNDVRSEGCNCGEQYFPSVNTLIWDEALADAAQLHAKDMGENNFFSHSGLNGSTPGERISAQGYSWSTYGENIAAGSPSPEDVVSIWLNSVGHCENIMNEDFTELGVGYYADGDIWVQVFAAPQ